MVVLLSFLFVLFFIVTATTEIYTASHTLSLHDALPILLVCCRCLAHGLKEPEDVPPNVAALIARACGFGSWDETLAAYDEARQCVTEHWSLIAKGMAA